MTLQTGIENGRRSEPGDSQPVRVYGPESLVRNESGVATGLSVAFHSIDFVLPMRKVGTDAQPAYIAWLDVNHDMHPLLAKQAVRDLAPRIARLNPSVVVAPHSNKSTWMTERATREASHLLSRHVLFINLLGDDKIDRLMEQQPYHYLPYHNVTSPEAAKFMGIRREDVKALKAHIQDGGQIAIADDVYSTGGTMDAMQSLLHETLSLPHDYAIPAAVLAAESTYGPGYPVQTPEYVHPLIHMPVFVGKIPG